MTDTDATDNGTERPEHLSLPPDSFKAVRDLIALVIDPRAVRRHLRQLHDALATVSTAQLALATERTAHDAHLAKDRAELEAERAAVQKRRVEVEIAEGRLVEREERIRELEAAWKNLGEPDDVRSGFRSPEFTPLQKAQRAFAGRPISSERFGQSTLTHTEPESEAA